MREISVQLLFNFEDEVAHALRPLLFGMMGIFALLWSGNREQLLTPSSFPTLSSATVEVGVQCGFYYYHHHHTIIHTTSRIYITPLIEKMNTSDTKKTSFSAFNAKANRRIYQEFTNHIETDKAYIAELEKILQDNGIEIPHHVVPQQIVVRRENEDRIMHDGTLNSLMKSMTSIKDHNQMHEIQVQYRNLSFWNVVPESKIATVGSTLRKCFLGSGPKRRVDILKDLNGRILPKTMTLLMGPPGCGKYS